MNSVDIFLTLTFNNAGDFDSLFNLKKPRAQNHPLIDVDIVSQYYFLFANEIYYKNKFNWINIYFYV